jgi:hypothetical protein
VREREREEGGLGERERARESKRESARERERETWKVKLQRVKIALLQT